MELGAGGEPRAKGPAELSWVLTLCALQFDYEYLETGERLVLGKGTYGVVYAGRDRHTRVRIAIKEIPERDSRCAALVHAGSRALEGGHEQVRCVGRRGDVRTERLWAWKDGWECDPYGEWGRWKRSVGGVIKV